MSKPLRNFLMLGVTFLCSFEAASGQAEITGQGTITGQGKITLAAAVPPPPPSGAPWAGILDSTRAIDWTSAGIPGGIPTITNICKTVPPSGINRWQPSHAYAVGNQISDNNGNLQRVNTAGTSGAAVPTWATTVGNSTTDNQVTWHLISTIPTAAGGTYTGNDVQNLRQASLDCMTSGGVIQLTAGTYYFTNYLSLMGNSNVVLRGAGPMQTTLRFYQSGPCQNGSYICISTPTGAPTSEYTTSYHCGADWTAGYAQGTTVLSVANLKGIALGASSPFPSCAFSTSLTPVHVSNTYGSGQIIYGSIIFLDQRSDEVGICPSSGGTNNCAGVAGASASGTTATIVTTIPHGFQIGKKVAVGEVTAQVTRWTASTAYHVGQAITDSTGYLVERVVTAGTSGTTEPIWLRNAPNSPTTDGTVTWTMGGCIASGSLMTGTTGYDGANYSTSCFSSIRSDLNGSLLSPSTPAGCGAGGAWMPPQGTSGAYQWSGIQIPCQWWTITDVGCIVSGVYVTSASCGANPIIAFRYTLPTAIPAEVNPAAGGLPSGNGFASVETGGILDSGIGQYLIGGPVVYLGIQSPGRKCLNVGSWNNVPGVGDLQCAPGESSRRNMMEAHRVTACTPNCTSPTSITIDPPILNTSFRSSQHPAIWFATTVIRDGIEDLTVDGLYDDGTSGGKVAASSAQMQGSNIEFWGCYQCWVRNVRSLWGGRDHIVLQQSTQTEVRDSYFYGTKNGQSTSYGVEPQSNDTSGLFINNIFQAVVSPIQFNGDSGSVEAYNYMVDPQYSPPGANISMHQGNHAFTNVSLHEGTVANTFNLDNNHGESWQVTFFRNRERVIQFPARDYPVGSMPASVMAFNRVTNLVGNVFGWPGLTRAYEQHGRPPRGGATGIAGMVIYTLGDGSIYPPDDPLVRSTLLRWGNYDTASGTARWCGTGQESGCQCGPAVTNLQVECARESEIPTVAFAGGVHGNFVPANQTLPASFFLTAQPAFWTTAWGTPGWPAIGPDVSASGPLDATCAITPYEPTFPNPLNPYPCDGVNHMSYLIPSQICFINSAVDTKYQFSIPITSAVFYANGTQIPNSNPATPAQRGGAVVLTLPFIDPTPDAGIYNRTGLSVPVAIEVSGVTPSQYNGMFVVQQVCGLSAGHSGYANCRQSPPTVTYFLNLGATVPSGNGTGGTAKGMSIRTFDAKTCYPNEPIQ